MSLPERHAGLFHASRLDHALRLTPLRGAQLRSVPWLALLTVGSWIKWGMVWYKLALYIAMATLDIVWWLAAARLIKSKLWRGLVGVFMAGQFLTMSCMLAGCEWPNQMPKAAFVAVMLWHFIGLTVAYAILFAKGAVRFWPKTLQPKAQSAVPSQNPSAPEETKTLSRREFLGTCAALTPPLAVVGLTEIAMVQLNEFRVKRFILPLPALPRALDGVTIAQVSDIHVGAFTNGRILKAIVNQTNALRADLVVMTGDLIDYSLADLSEGIAMVKAMEGRYGQWMIEGNHDLFENASEFERRVKAAGVPFLLNETAVTQVRGYPVQFLGLRWMFGNGKQCSQAYNFWVRELMKQHQAEAFPILLAHHPHAFDAAIKAGLPLTLSGHTHGGYCMLTQNIGLGPILFRYWSGLYRRQQSQMIVSNGVGNSFPLRVNAPAEITHITLRCIG